MKKILAALVGGLLIGAFGVPYAKLLAPTAEEKAAAAAKAEKDSATKAKAAKELGQAQDRAVVNYKKKEGSSFGGATGVERAPDTHSATPRGRLGH